MRDAAENFDLDPQRFQPVHIEILCEAEDLIPRLARIANPYGVEVYSGAGYGGLKGKRSFAERAQARGKPTVVLNISDRDKDGDAIYVAVAEGSVAWAGNVGAVFELDWYEEAADQAALGKRVLRLGDACRGAIFFMRFALTEAQAADLGLLDADGKAEVDGAPVEVMDGWITEAIRALQTRRGRKRHRVAVKQERARLPELLHTELAALDENERRSDDGRAAPGLPPGRDRLAACARRPAHGWRPRGAGGGGRGVALLRQLRDRCA